MTTSQGRQPKKAGGLGRWLAVVAMMLGILLSACQPEPPLERLDPVQNIVAGVVPGTPEEISGRLIRWLNDKANRLIFDESYGPSPTTVYSSLLNAVRAAGAWQNAFITPPDDAFSAADTDGNPALQAYLRLSAAQRANDIYLMSYDNYWLSEYALAGRVLPFTCSFIVHLQALDTERTRVEIIEVLPMVNAGKKIALSAHALLPGEVLDLRHVPPTTRDRIELLNRISELMAESEPED